jgi:glycosyltransferase involved in cell wall biosynthesis
LKVLHVQKVAGIGGSERHLLTLLPALAARGVEVRMCVLAAGQPGLFIERMREQGVPVSVIAAGPDLNPILELKLATEMRRFRPDLIHTHLVHADLYGQPVARLLAIPGVASAHRAPGFYRKEPYRSMGRAAGRLARRTIAISHYVGAFIREVGLARPGDVRVIHYGIESAGWRLSDDERSRARQRMGIGSGEVVVGVASRLISGKGHALLLDAIALASGDIPTLRVLVAGQGPLRASLERKALSTGDPGCVRFVGFVADIREFMNACDVIAIPTTPDFGEGFGLAALEAMATGRPVLATAVGSLPEVVIDGESGWLVPPTPEDLCRALRSLGTDGDLRGRLGDAAQRRARDVFGVSPMVDQTLAVYDEVA